MKLFFLFLLTLIVPLNIFGITENTYKNTTETVSVKANNDIALFHRNQPIEIDVLYNDYGFGSGILSLTIANAPEHGTVKVTSSNRIIYTPKQNYLGDDSFNYTICSLDGSCDVATVFIYVAEYDYQPIAINDTITFQNDHKAKEQCTVLSNDRYLWDEPLIVKIITELSSGKTVVNPNNTITPTFTDNFIGNDTLSYSVTDREGDSDTAWVFFTVIPKELELNFNAPNGISPNGDGLNDLFYISSLDGYDALEIQIFDQLGSLVYNNKQYQNNWNGSCNSGKYSGQDLPSGTYYYLIQIKDTSTKLTGYIYISR